jgi:hypothetical protein
VIEINLRVVAFLFELVGIAPHLDVVVRHRAIFYAQERFGRQQAQHERNSNEQYRKKGLPNGTNPVLGIGRSHDLAYPAPDRCDEKNELFPYPD